MVVARLPAEMECTNTDTNTHWQTIDKHMMMAANANGNSIGLNTYKRLIAGLGASHYEVDTNIKEINNGLPRYLLVTGFSVHSIHV